MRKLGELVGVSRTALYHHFSNKSDLLSAVAESGFNAWQSNTESVLAQAYQTDRAMLLSYVRSYFDFALQHSAKYELMFGREIWAQDQSSDSLHQIAYRTFDYHVELVRRWQEKGIIDKRVSSLRAAQVTWGTLHGISKLFIDGVYVDDRNLDELADTVVALLLT
jgi:AcrR family transcriptional regulator